MLEWSLEMPVIYRTQSAVSRASANTLWCTQMKKWSDCADEDFLGYIRQRESKRTVKWLAEAGLLDLRDARTRFEIRHCQETIHTMPRFDHLRPGKTTWIHRYGDRPVRRPPHAGPPPLPPWAVRRSKSSTDD